jgi:trehalose 6-phosphate synthase
MCNYDLVGFQTEIDAANFERYVTNECPIQGCDRQAFQSADRTFRVGIFPVGVETAQLNRLARRAAQSPFVHDVVRSLADRAMIIGVDRLDYSKGIVLRMEAFDVFSRAGRIGEGR